MLTSFGEQTITSQVKGLTSKISKWNYDKGACYEKGNIFRADRACVWRAVCLQGRTFSYGPASARFPRWAELQLSSNPLRY